MHLIHRFGTWGKLQTETTFEKENDAFIVYNHTVERSFQERTCNSCSLIQRRDVGIERRIATKVIGTLSEKEGFV